MEDEEEEEKEQFVQVMHLHGPYGGDNTAALCAWANQNLANGTNHGLWLALNGQNHGVGG